MGQECGYLSHGESYLFAYKEPVKESLLFANSVPFIGAVQNSHGESLVFNYKEPIKESILFANGVTFIVAIQNPHRESMVFAYIIPFISAFKKSLKESQLLTSF
jgi:hypothetical protein